MNLSKNFILILVYSSVFLIIGQVTVYLPSWLNKELSLDARIISLILGITALIKSFTNIALIKYIKEPKHLKNYLYLLCIFLIISYFLIILCLNYNATTLILILVVISLVVFSPSIPVIENINNNINKEFNFNYGKIRLFGSISFLISVFLVGFLINKFTLILYPYIFLLFSMFFFISVATLPSSNLNKVEKFNLNITNFFKIKKSFLIIVFCSLLQSSHSNYYTFSTLIWNNNGLNLLKISYLWTWAIVIEIILFYLINKINIKHHLINLLYVCATLSFIRWFITPLTFNFYHLFALQSIHAISFGLTHYIMMYYIYNLIPIKQKLMAQLFYFSFTGLFTTFLTVLSGQVYFYFSSKWSYWLMSLICIICVVILNFVKNERFIFLNNEKSSSYKKPE